MKIVFPEIHNTFDTDQGVVNGLVIEEPRLFRDILTDIQEQLEGRSGDTFLSENDKEIPIAKNVEVLSQFIPFVISKRNLTGKVVTKLEEIALQDNHSTTMEMMAILESYLVNLAFDLPGDIEFSKVSIGAILKAVGATFCEDYNSLAEKLIDYMELVKEYDHCKLFIFVNLRGYLSEQEAQLFFDTIRSHQYHVVMIDNHESTILNGEKRYLIDQSCCEIQ